MNMYKILLTILISSAMLLTFHCSSSTSQIAGGASGTEVSAVVGTVINPDGSPASKSCIFLRPADYLPDSAASESYRASHSIVNTFTKQDGTFSIDSILPDTYRIEISKDTLSVMISTRVPSEYTIITLPEEKLILMAEISGIVHIDNVDTGRGRVQIYGMERTICADSTGKFKVRVPVGSHTLHVDAASTDLNKSVDNMEVRLDVNAGEMRDVGTFNLTQPSMRPCIDGTCDSNVIRSVIDTLKLSSVPLDSFCKWQNGRIVALSFRGRQIGFIPREISKLMRVTDLDLGRTGITSLFHDIGVMHNLIYLHLDSNNLKKLPKEIGSLQYCKVLDISSNELDSLPGSITYLRALVYLDLSRNRLCSLDDFVKQWAQSFDSDWQVTQRCNQSFPK